MHALGVIMSVSSGCDTVQPLMVKGARELIERTIDVRDGDDTGCVVELMRKKCLCQ